MFLGLSCYLVELYQSTKSDDVIHMAASEDTDCVYLLPVHAALCFPRSPRYNPSSKDLNRMFEGFSTKLNDLYPDINTAASEDADVDTSSNNLDTSSQQPPTVELVPLLIDVSGYVRERSQYTQYLNFCYTVKSLSK